MGNEPTRPASESALTRVISRMLPWARDVRTRAKQVGAPGVQPIFFDEFHGQLDDHPADIGRLPHGTALQLTGYQSDLLSHAPGYAERERRGLEFRTEKRKHPFRDSWTEGYGRFDTFFSDEIYGQAQAAEELSTTERLVETQLRHRLDAQRLARTQRPVVAVDFGGGVGVSFLKLAERFKKEITRGELALIVTNLGLTSEGVRANLEHPNSQAKPWERELFERSHSLVNYIQADAQELSHAVVPGTLLPIRRSVDLVHEANALMHGYVNDVDLPRLGTLLNSQGVLLLGSIEEVHPKRHEPPYRAEAHQCGLRNLERVGLARADLGRSSRYGVFAHPETALDVFRSAALRAAKLA